MNPNVKRLYELLKFKRPSDSTTEKEFVERWLMPQLPDPQKDEYGNVWVRIGDEKGPTMFSCHTDTVHMTEGIQKLVYDTTKYHIFSDKENCLGADDGTGIWLMMHLIDAKVPGLYIFHRDEECGGLGSRHIAQNYAPALQYVKHCIALDRAGTTDLITHQSGGTECASKSFATQLASHLPGFLPCERGVFTDSYNYRGLIPECVNLSVGYYSQHTSAEYQDLKFAYELATTLEAVPWGALVPRRTPEIKTYRAPKNQQYASTLYGNYDAYASFSDSSGEKQQQPRRAGKPRPQYAPKEQLRQLVKDNPEAAVGLLQECSVTLDDLAYARRMYGRNNRTLELQQSSNLRVMPTGGKKEVH